MSLFWLILGLVVCYGSYELDLGSVSSPGPGFYPFLSGALMAGFSIILLIVSDVKRLGRVKGGEFILKIHRYKRIAMGLLSLTAFMIFLNSLGFFLCTLFLIAFLLRGIGSQKWKTVISGSVCTAIGAVLLFQWILKCELPRGILGF